MAAPVFAADDAAQLRQDKADAEKELTNLWKGQPELPAEPIRQIVLLNKVDKLLQISCPAFDNTTPQGVIAITDLPGKASLRVMRSTVGSVGALTFINLDYYNFADPNNVESHVQIVSSPGRIELVHDVAFPDQTTQTVSLRQIANPDPPSHAVELHVQVLKENAAAPQPESVYSADNLDALIYEHPVEVEKYLRPLLREIHQDDRVLGLNENAAWQVLAPLYKPSPELTATVDGLIAQFKSDDYAVRSQAARELKSLGGPAAAYLLSRDRRGLTDEQSARIDEFLQGYRLLNDSQAADNLHSPDFLLDCLGSENDALRKIALAQLSTIAGHSVQFDAGASPDDRAAAIQRLRRQLVPITAPASRPS